MTNSVISYSPGPWHACNDGKCKCHQVWTTPSDHPVCEVLSGKWGDDYPAIRVDPQIGGKAEAYMDMIVYGEILDATAVANCRLIAAAPELLEALKGACTALREEKRFGTAALFELVIAKAEDAR